jgi:hypothetical protein
MLTNRSCQRWPELLDPTQNRSAAHVNASIGEYAGDTFGCGSQLQVIPDGEQDDVTWEAMTCEQAGGLDRGMPATASAGADDPTTFVVAIASEIG